MQYGYNKRVVIISEEMYNFIRKFVIAAVTVYCILHEEFDR